MGFQVAYGLPRWLSGKESTCQSMQEMEEMLIPSLGCEDPLEEGTATHSSILAWRIPWTEEPGRLQSMDSQSGNTTERQSMHNSILVLLMDV